jgi:hypothetical protein
MTRRSPRRFCLCLLLLALPAPLAAQGRAVIGVELGYTRASFNGRDAGGVTLHEGAVAGAYFQVRLASWLALRPGLQIASKGGATTVVPVNATDAVRVDLDLVYLDLPVLFRSRLPALGKTRLILTGGMVPGLRIGCNVEVSNAAVVLARSECKKVSVGAFRSWDVEALGGVGFGIPIENSELAIEARYTQGLRSVSDFSDIKNRALTFVISVPF